MQTKGCCKGNNKEQRFALNTFPAHPRRSVLIVFLVSSRLLWFLLEAGKEVGHDIAGATHEDEVVGGGVGQGRAVGFGDGGMEGAVEAVGPSAFRHFLSREGPVGRGLRPVIGGLAGQKLP